MGFFLSFQPWSQSNIDGFLVPQYSEPVCKESVELEVYFSFYFFRRERRTEKMGQQNSPKIQSVQNKLVLLGNATLINSVLIVIPLL